MQATFTGVDGAFAAVFQDGTVVRGGQNYGGDSYNVQAALRRVDKLSSPYDAFAAMLKDGTVVTWGDKD